MNAGGAPVEVIDYDQVYGDYLRSLVDTLRGFSAGLPGLELWVPHEDPRLSLRNLLDVAAAAGKTSLCVRFGTIHRGTSTGAELQGVAAGYGDAVVTSQAGAVVVTIENLRPAALPAPGGTTGRGASPTATPVRRARDATSTATVSSSWSSSSSPRAPSRHRIDVYEARLRRAAANLRHERASPPTVAAPLLLVVATCDGFDLTLVIDPATHVVTAAQFSSPRGPTATPPDGQAATPGDVFFTRALLDQLCGLAVGLPLLEVAYNAVIRLEADLRDEQAPPPLPGIVLPVVSHPLFARPTALLRDALASYREKTGYAETVNRFDQAPARAWMQADLAARLALIDAAIAEPVRIAGFAPGAIAATAIEHDVRVVLALPDELKSMAKQRLLLDLETHIKRRVDPRLEVYVEERKDRNKLRRLAVVKEAS